MIRRVLLILLMVVMAVGLQSNEIGVTALRNNAMKGLNVESGYEQEMAVWAYYCINGADGIAINYNEAVKILEKLVTRDKNKVNSEKFTYVVEGYNLLGNCYENGWGVTKDQSQAIDWWILAANKGSKAAKSKLKKLAVYTNKGDKEVVTQVTPPPAPPKEESKAVPKAEPKPTPTSNPAPEQVFTAVEQKAIYPGGDAALLLWISLNLQYPTTAQEEGIEGRVYVKFVVEKDGSIGPVQIARGKHEDLDAEAMRVVKEIPHKFTPAKQNGEAVRSWVTLPITFKLNK